jgi:hypothetical protein
MILRACVVIPVFDNPATVAEVVARTLLSCSFPVLVVDDGSARPVRELLAENSRVEVLRLATNQGKGMALRSAIKWCLSRGFTHMLTLDGDSQHYPEDLPAMASEVLAHPWNLVVGERAMDSSALSISHFGKRSSNFWVRYQSDNLVRDSQSGFRAYPLFPLQTMRFLSRRYDFEIEVLVRLLWRGVEVSHVPVRVLYPPAGERISHFRKFRDNVRISILNTLLVALSLCRRHSEPLPAALAVGIGTFVGTTPLYGLHSAIVIIISVVFRLNAPLLLLGSQIPIPPLAPFLALACLNIGGRLLDQQGEFETTKKYYKFLGRDGMARPFLFQNSLHHSTAGMLSQTLGIRGPSATVSDHYFSGESALDLAQNFLDSAHCSTCLVVGVDTFVPELNLGVRARYPEGLEFGEGAAALLVTKETATPLFRIVSSRVLRAHGAENPGLTGFYDSNAIEQLAASTRIGILALPKPDGTSSRFELEEPA